MTFDPTWAVVISVLAWVCAAILYGLTRSDCRAIEKARQNLEEARTLLLQVAGNANWHVTHAHDLDLLMRARIHIDKART